MGIKSKLSEALYKIKNNPSFTVKEQLGYAGGMFGNAMGQDCVYTYSDKFNRDFLNIRPGHLIAMGNVTTILSFLVPPVAGSLLDRPVRDNKMSVTKRILLTTPLPFALMATLLFVVPSSSPIINLVWSFVLTILFATVDTFYDMALSTISLRMTTNQQDRKNFYTISSLAASLGSMLPGWLLPIVIGRITDVNNQKWAYFFIALVFCVLGVSSMYAPYFTLSEKVGTFKVHETEKIQWDRKTISAILHNRPFMVSMIATIFETIRKVTYELLPYFYQNTLDDYGMKAAIDAISGGLSYVGLLSVPMVGKKVSARNMLIGGYLYSALFYTAMTLFAVPFDLKRIRRLRYAVGVLLGFSGMPNAGMSAAQKILIADSTDYMEWYTEKKYGEPIRSDGMLMAVQSVTGKIVTLLRTNIHTISLRAVGYKSGQQDSAGRAIQIVQSTKTLKGIYLVTTLCGVIGNVLPAIAYLFDSFTGKRQQLVLEELALMRAQRAQVVEQTKQWVTEAETV